MDDITSAEFSPPSEPPVGATRVKAFTRVLQQYKSARSKTERRIIESESWWKLRNSELEAEVLGSGNGYKSSSAWMHNVIASKHADVMDAIPEATMLPVEEGDKAEAELLTDIMPVVLEHNDFEEMYSTNAWRKLKTGTACYKVVWDQSKLNGLGDIHITSVNLLDLYWEPGITNINDSRYIFHCELIDKDILEERYPQLAGNLKVNTTTTAKFLYDDNVITSHKCTVIDVYYRRVVNGKTVLHYAKYVGDTVLYATENEPDYATRGLYDHGEYPYVFDALYPIEGSPCGYGFVDICRNPQIAIDLIQTAAVKSAMVGAIPRHFVSNNSKINEEEFLDLDNPLIHVEGSINDTQFRPVEHKSFDPVYNNVKDGLIAEMRETSGNTETSTGTTNSGVTAAAAIAALQEASGKGSRDAIGTSYRAFRKVVSLAIEIIRQFYDAPRHFRITGQGGVHKYVTYTNNKLQERSLGSGFGVDFGTYKPVFDVKVKAHKKTAFSLVAQNELALQLYDKGMLNPMPMMVDQSILCLGMMDFDGRDELIQKLMANGTMLQKLMTYLPFVVMYAQATGDPALEQAAMQDYAMYSGGQALALPSGGGQTSGDTNPEEHGTVTKAREQSRNAAQPA
jgi:hypothetical protein